MSFQDFTKLYHRFDSRAGGHLYNDIPQAATTTHNAEPDIVKEYRSSRRFPLHSSHLTEIKSLKSFQNLVINSRNLTMLSSSKRDPISRGFCRASLNLISSRPRRPLSSQIFLCFIISQFVDTSQPKAYLISSHS